MSAIFQHSTIMDKKIQKIAKELKNNISSKYEVDELKVFGSSARDDRREDSDIDIYLIFRKIVRDNSIEICHNKLVYCLSC